MKTTRKPKSKSAPLPATRSAPLSSVEAKAMTALRARKEALSRSDVNAKCHAICEAIREVHERVLIFLSEVDGNAGIEVLKEAGLGGPGSAIRWGGGTFFCTVDKTRELAEHLDDYLALAPCDLPPLPHAVQRTAA